MKIINNYYHHQNKNGREKQNHLRNKLYLEADTIIDIAKTHNHGQEIFDLKK